MTTTAILIVSAIASAFLLFGGVLAWGDFYSRGVRRDLPAAPEQSTTTPTNEHRRAA